MFKKYFFKLLLITATSSKAGEEEFKQKSPLFENAQKLKSQNEVTGERWGCCSLMRMMVMR